MRSGLLIKSQIIAIAYSGIVKQLFKLCKTNQQTNQKLFKGEQIGQRVSDEFNERVTSSAQPTDTVPAFLQGILKEYMGCNAQISPPQIAYGKGKFSLKFTIILKQNPISDFIVLGRSRQQNVPLNYHSIIMGFINGSLKTMAFNPSIKMVADALVDVNQLTASLVLSGRGETVFQVDMWKVKQDD